MDSGVAEFGHGKCVQRLSKDWKFKGNAHRHRRNLFHNLSLQHKIKISCLYVNKMTKKQLTNGLTKHCKTAFQAVSCSWGTRIRTSID